jgi:hypothetical protein
VPTIAANQKPIPTRMPIAAVTQMEAAAPQARRNLWRAPGVSQPEPLGLLRIVLEGAELWAKVGDGVKRVRRRIVGVFEASTSPTKE